MKNTKPTRRRRQQPVKPDPVTKEEVIECITCLWGVVDDVLPQLGNIVLQNYGRLNRGLILARKILRK